MRILTQLTFVSYVWHRVVRGGNFHEPVVIDKETYHYIEQLSDLAPLHNGAALSAIEASVSNLEHVTSIAYFNTTFHRDMPQHIPYYAINQDTTRRKCLKTYSMASTGSAVRSPSVVIPPFSQIA
ncbi:hypothetical protein BC827DRAFT_656376 [Russula dissimulans]|nr:hypothetical protein BC827DRAFT_656376 [Russula dissimulans]